MVLSGSEKSDTKKSVRDDEDALTIRYILTIFNDLTLIE
jgi:hypothetical protein